MLNLVRLSTTQTKDDPARDDCIYDFPRSFEAENSPPTWQLRGRTICLHCTVIYQCLRGCESRSIT